MCSTRHTKAVVAFVLFCLMFVVMVTNQASILWSVTLYKHNKINMAAWFITVALIQMSPHVLTLAYVIWNTPFVSAVQWTKWPKWSNLAIGFLFTVIDVISCNVFMTTLAPVLPSVAVLPLLNAVFIVPFIHLAIKTYQVKAWAKGEPSKAGNTSDNKKIKLQVKTFFKILISLFFLVAVGLISMHLYRSERQLAYAIILPMLIYCLSFVWNGPFQLTSVTSSEKQTCARMKVSGTYAVLALVLIPPISLLTFWYSYRRISSSLGMVDVILSGFMELANTNIWVPLLLNISCGVMGSLVSFVSATTGLSISAIYLPSLSSTPVATTVTFLLINKLDSISLSTNFQGRYWIVAISVILWILPYCVFGTTILKPSTVLLKPFNELFIHPTWNGVFYVQRLILNYISDDMNTSKYNANSLPCKLANTNSIVDRKVFICTTMYRESENEMTRLLLSLQKVSVSNRLGKTYIEAHIFLDDGCESNQLKPSASRLKKIMTDTLKIAPRFCRRFVSPYGFQYRCIIPGGLPLFVHFKDRHLCKSKKRWSQVMYMNYILNHRCRVVDWIERSVQMSGGDSVYGQKMIVFTEWNITDCKTRSMHGVRVDDQDDSTIPYFYFGIENLIFDKDVSKQTIPDHSMGNVLIDKSQAGESSPSLEKETVSKTAIKRNRNVANAKIATHDDTLGVNHTLPNNAVTSSKEDKIDSSISPQEDNADIIYKNASNQEDQVLSDTPTYRRSNSLPNCIYAHAKISRCGTRDSSGINQTCALSSNSKCIDEDRRYESLRFKPRREHTSNCTTNSLQGNRTETVEVSIDHLTNAIKETLKQHNQFPILKNLRPEFNGLVSWGDVRSSNRSSNGVKMDGNKHSHTGSSHSFQIPSQNHHGSLGSNVDSTDSSALTSGAYTVSKEENELNDQELDLSDENNGSLVYSCSSSLTDIPSYDGTPLTFYRGDFYPSHHALSYPCWTCSRSSLLNVEDCEPGHRCWCQNKSRYSTNNWLLRPTDTSAIDSSRMAPTDRPFRSIIGDPSSCDASCTCPGIATDQILIDSSIDSVTRCPQHGCRARDFCISHDECRQQEAETKARLQEMRPGHISQQGYYGRHGEWNCSSVRFHYCNTCHARMVNYYADASQRQRLLLPRSISTGECNCSRREENRSILAHTQHKQPYIKYPGEIASISNRVLDNSDGLYLCNASFNNFIAKSGCQFQNLAKIPHQDNFPIKEETRSKALSSRSTTWPPLTYDRAYQDIGDGFMGRNSVPQMPDDDKGYSSTQTLPSFNGEAKQCFDDRTYILATDADMEFDDKNLLQVVTLSEQNLGIGGACGRTHPVGSRSSPIVWYQKFEYAKDFWMIKTAQNVIGCVMCCPGCFSLYRATAVNDVLKKYSQPTRTPFDVFIKDNGEDRWMCTLMMLSGWKLEYTAESSNTTFCPDTFLEFLKQRRRWVLSEISNLLLVFKNLDELCKRNRNFSLVYVTYIIQMFLLVILSPSFSMVMLTGALDIVFGISFLITTPIVFLALVVYIYVCLRHPMVTQARLTLGLTSFLGATMMAISVGFVWYVVKDIQKDGFGEFKQYYLIVVLMSVVVYSALLRPSDSWNLVYGLAFLIVFPAMYILLPFYAVANIVDQSWGTRDENPKLQKDSKNKEESKDESKNETHELEQNSNRKDGTLPQLKHGTELLRMEHDFWEDLGNTVIGNDVNLGTDKETMAQKLTRVRNKCMAWLLMSNFILLLILSGMYLLVPTNNYVFGFVLCGLYSFSLIIQMIGMTIERFDSLLKVFVQSLAKEKSVDIWVRR